MFALLAWIAVASAALVALSGAPVSVTVRTGLLLCGAAFAALATGARPALWLATVIVSATVADALLARRTPAVERRVDHVLARGVKAPLELAVAAAPGTTVRVRQPLVPDIDIEPPEADGGLRASVRARRRGVHELPAPALRVRGPLGLAAWYRRARNVPATTLRVYPDLPAARRIAVQVRKGRFPDAGLLLRGPLGLGTEFELVREYVADDDVRQVNWRATQRMARPMSNQFRIEQDRDVLIVIDCGRLMAAPVIGPDRVTHLTRLDASLDAAAAVAYVADEVGDRCGVVAFDDVVRRSVPPRRRNGERVVEATFDLQPSTRDADYEAAFRRVNTGKRAFALVLTDLLDEAAAAALVEAVPVLARRHAVVVASVADPDLRALVATPPREVEDVYRASVALDVLDARARTADRLGAAGTTVIEAEPGTLAAACVRAYLRAKGSARF